MIQLVIIVAYLLMLLTLGVFSSRLFRGTSKDYMLASHSIGPFLLLMSLFGTTMTAFALVGSTGEAYKAGVGVYGLLASSSGIVHSLCFFLIGVKLWQFGKKYGYTTQIQFFRDRLENNWIGLLLFPILVGLVIPYLLIGVMASGTVINGVTEGAFENAFASSDYGLPKWLGSLIISVVVLIYVFFGGMRGTAWVNTFQTSVFIVLGVVTFFIISNKLGGIQAASQAVKQKHPSRLMLDVSEQEQKQYEADYQKWETLAWYSWAVSEKGLELTDDQIARAHASQTPPAFRVAEAQLARQEGLLDELTSDDRQQAVIRQDDRTIPVGASLFQASGEPRPLEDFPRLDESAWHAKAEEIFANNIGHPSMLLDENDPSKGYKWTLKKARGVYMASNWAPQESTPIDPWRFLSYLLVPLSVGMFPHIFQHWLTAKSANSFKLPVVAHPIFIMIVWAPCVLVGVWATAAVYEGRPVIPPHFPANAVLPKMVSVLTSASLGGLLSAGILAAIMSSLDSQFLCLGTIFTNDIVIHYSRKKRFSEKQIVVMARLFIVAIVAITYLLSLAEPRRVFQMGVWCFSGFSSLFPLVFAAVYWKRLTAAGAIASVLTAIGLWGYLFYQSDFAKNDKFEFFGMMPVVVMVGASTVALILVSLVTRPPSEKTLSRFFQASTK